ncbi:MAG: hypothetical protein GY870_18385, partial [archaeon]|nr:hypothetical protein [archaeon]
MKNKKTIHLSITISLLSILIIAPIFALGDTRKVELTGFLEELQDEIDEDFKDTIISGDTDIYATCSAIKIQTMLGIAVSDSLSILKDTIEGKIQGYTADKDIEKLAFALEGLDTIGGISGLGTENTNNIHILLNSFKETYGSNIGFRMSENENVTVAGTYYALKCFYHLDHAMSNITSNLTSINSYVLSCYNSTVGGFISNTTDLSAPNLL